MLILYARRGHIRGVKAATAATVFFYLVQGRVSVMVHLIGIAFWGKDPAYAERDLGQAVRGVTEGVVDGLDLLLNLSLLSPVNAGQDHGELIASHPGGKISRAEALSQQPGHFFQYLVPNLVAIAIVYQLELIHVNQQ